MKNQIKTIALLGGLMALFGVFGYWVAGTNGLIFFLGLAGVINFFAYFFSDKMVLGLYKATPLNERQFGAIYQIVDELRTTMGLPMPRLWLIDQPIANAMATGRNPHNASVAVTTGILEILDKKELRGVLAHEMSHIKNRDILIMTIAATLATAIGQLSYSMQQMFRYGPRQQEDGTVRDRRNPLVLLVASIIMPIAAALVRLGISRSREYMADETGAYISKDPLALASALEKLQDYKKVASYNKYDTKYATTAPLFILNPFAAGSVLRSLFATHPAVEDRVARLQEIARKLKK